MEDNEPTFIDAEQVWNKEVSSMKELIMRHLGKISEISSKEFCGGYWNSYGNNPVNHTYVPDTRDSYVNAIDFLYDVLYPRFDEEMKEADKKITKEENEAFEEIKDDVKKQPKTKAEFYLPFRRKMFRALSLLIHRIKLFENLQISE